MFFYVFRKIIGKLFLKLNSVADFATAVIKFNFEECENNSYSNVAEDVENLNLTSVDIKNHNYSRFNGFQTEACVA